MKNEALKFLKKICKNRVKVTKRMVIFFLMTGGLLLSQVNFSETVDETKPATIKYLKNYTSEEVGKVKKEIEGLKEETIENLKNYDYPNSLHFVSVHYSKEDVKEYEDYYKYLDLLKKRLEYLKEIEIEKLNGNSKEKIREIRDKKTELEKQMKKLKEGNELISQKVTNEIEKNLKKPKNSDKDKKIEEINKEYTERMNEINKLSTNFNNLGIDFAHSIAIGKGAEISGENGIAIGVDTLSGKDSISLGKDAIADGEGNIAIGRDATLFSKTFKEKVGQQIARILNDPNTIVKFENEGDVEYKKTIVIGDGTKSSGNSNIAIGDNAVAMKKRLTLISLNPGGTLSNKDGAEIDARNWNDIAKQFYKPDDDDKRNYTFEAKPVENAIALGKNASAFANNVIAIGKGAISGFESAVSIGENADTEGENSVAIGKNSKIFGESSVAIGEGSRTGKIKYVLKTIDGKDTVEKTEEFDTIEEAKQELEKKNDHSKIYRIEVGGEKSEYSVAIGKTSAVEHSGSVAIGADSLAVKSDVDGAFTGAKHTSGETVSFGKKDRKRRLTNIADGSADSDAVTVAQLKKAIDGNKGGSGGSAVDSTLKLSNGKETKDLSLKDDTLELVDGTNTTVSLSKDNNKATFKVDVNSNLTGITSITNGTEDIANKNSKIELKNDKLILTNKGKSIKILTKGTEGNEETRIEFDRPVKNKKSGGKLDPNPPKEDYGIGIINYLKDRRASKDTDYGTGTNIGRAATEGAVKEVDSKINVVYTDKDGNKLVGLVKANNNKYYKAEYVENNGELKEEYKNEEGKELKDIFATLLNPDGTTNNLTTKLRVADGNIETNSKDAINGGQLNKELEKKLDKEDLDVKGDDKYITVSSKGNKYTVSFNDSEIKNTVNNSDFSSNKSIQDMLGKKADLDATNVIGDNLTKWQAKLGTGTVAKDNKGLVTGGTVYNYIDKIKQDLSTKGTGDLSKKLDVDAKNITTEGVTNLTTNLGTGKIEDNNTNLVKGGVVKTYVDNKLKDKLSSSDVDVKGDDEYISVTGTGNKYTVAFKKDKLTDNINNFDFNKNTSIQNMLGKKADLDGTNLKNINLTVWQSTLGNGEVKEGNTGLVTGQTVYNYINPINTKVNQLSTSLNDKLSDITINGDTYIKTEKINNSSYNLSLNKDSLETLINSKTANLAKTDTITNINKELDKKANLDASNVTGDSLTAWQTKLGNGTIDDGNTGLVNGGVVKTYVDSKIENNTSTINTTLDKKLNTEDLDVKGDDKYITVTNEDKTKKKYKVAFNEDNLKQLVNSTDITNNTSLKTKLDTKADKDANNLNDTDISSWQTKLGNGSVTEGDTKLVKGGTVFTYVNETVNNIKQQLSTKSTEDLAKKLDVDAKNITDTGVTTLTTKLGTGEIKDNNNNLVTGGTVKKYITDEISTIDNKVSGKLSSDDVAVKGDEYINVASDTTKPNHYTLTFDKSKLGSDIDLTNNTKLNEQFNKYALLDGTNLDSINLTVWQAKLGDGKIASDNTGLVTGKTVFNYIDPINTKVDQLSTSLNDKLSDITITGDEYIKTKKINNSSYTVSFNKDNLETLINSKTVNLAKNDTITNINTELGKKANKDASNITGTDLTSWQSTLGNGTMTDNNEGLVTGGVVKTYVDSKIENNTSTINTTLNKKLNTDDLDVKGDDKYITVTNEDSTKKKYKVAFNEDNLKQLVNSTDITNNTSLKTKLDTKADKDANNLNDTDISSWQTKLGNGSVTEGDTKLVKGGTVFTYVNETVNNIKQQLSTKSTEDLAKKLDVDAKNITDTGVTTLTTKLGTGEIKDNNNNLVTGGTVKKYITDEINTINNNVSGKLSSDDVNVKGDDYISVASDNTKTNHYTLTFDKEKLASDIDLTKNTKLNEQFNKYALLDGSNLENINLSVWQAKLGNGTISKDNTGLVKGGDIYNYVNTIKQELTNQSSQDLSNKLDKDGSNLDKESLDKLTGKLSEGSDLTTPTNRLVTDTKVSEALKGKLNVDADNLSENGVATLTTKLGKGEVAEGDTKLVTGGKVYTKLNEIKTDLDNKYTNLNGKVATNTDDITALKTTVEGLKNTTQEINNIKTKLDDKLDKSDLSIKGDDYIKVENTNFNYKLSLNKDTLAKDLDLTNNTSVNNMFITKLGNINTNIGELKTSLETNTNNINSLTTKVETNTNDITTLKQDMTKKLDADANNLSADGITNLTNKLSKDSNIAKPKDRLVTDKQVNTYLSRYNDALGVVDKKSTVALEKSELALGGVANAVAMANLVQVNSYSRHRHNLSAAYGYYGGSHALAVGFSGTNEERNFVYKLSGSVNNKGNLAFGVGAGVMLGNKDERLTTEYSTKLKTVEKDLVEANKKIKEYEERQKATDIKVKELERKLNQILNKH
ncbi:YadA-like family protein [Sneathia vaginalis]|uniref:YadA-like family protein n=1 Tax=Sneathia vaginalis TaxID=187101 RepID=UPI002889AD16|nr:YadA-like family protein [Sneathia vaginalis]